MIDENMIYEAQRMLHERCIYYQHASNRATNKESKIRFAGKASAYSSACDILLAAVLGSPKLLKEFDCYKGNE